MVAVVCGAEDYRLENLAGASIGQIRGELKALMNISARAESRVDGVVVGPDYELTETDSWVEFVVVSGWKGGGDFVWMADDHDRLHRIAPEAVEDFIKRGFRVMEVANEVLDINEGSGMLPMIAPTTARASQTTPKLNCAEEGKTDFRQNEQKYLSAMTQAVALPFPVEGRTSVLEQIAVNLARIANHFDPPPPDIVDTPYIAGRLGVTTTRIAQMVREGTIPTGCIVSGSGNGRLWKFHRRQMEEWLAKRG